MKSRVTENLYNAASTVDIPQDHNEPLNKRAKLDTGTHCNYECSFCYYITKLNEKTSLEEIKKRIDYYHECGIKELDLSGGESSIHKNWFEILNYCTDKGIGVSTLSNGFKFAKEEFIKKSKDHGLNEILFSLHGYDSESHDSIVGRKHSFKKMIQAIENANRVGIRVRINCTVTNANFKNLETEFSNLIKKIQPFEVNFLTLNYWDDADSQEEIAYDEITTEIKKSIDIIKDHTKIINVRYTPFCFMKGYEKYVCNYYQHIYDIYDWNIAVYETMIAPEEYKNDPYQSQFIQAKKNRMESYKKDPECLKCKNYFICDGVEKKTQHQKLIPTAGTRVKEINYYRKGFYEED